MTKIKIGVMYKNKQGHGITIMSHPVEGLDYYIVRLDKQEKQLRFQTKTMTAAEIRKFLGLKEKERIVYYD